MHREQPVPEISALESLHEPLIPAELADHARVSLRTFVRRFGEEVGMSPGRGSSSASPGHVAPGIH